jgi:hypothetical protein
MNPKERLDPAINYLIGTRGGQLTMVANDHAQQFKVFANIICSENLLSATEEYITGLKPHNFRIAIVSEQ